MKQGAHYEIVRHYSAIFSNSSAVLHWELYIQNKRSHRLLRETALLEKSKTCLLCTAFANGIRPNLRNKECFPGVWDQKEGLRWGVTFLTVLEFVLIWPPQASISGISLFWLSFLSTHGNGDAHRPRLQRGTNGAKVGGRVISSCKVQLSNFLTLKAGLEVNRSRWGIKVKD